MNKYIYIIGVALFLNGSVNVSAQVLNDNEDEVNKISNRFAEQDFVPGQVLVKFNDANRISVRRARGQFASTNVSKVTAVLQKYGTREVEQLLPNQNPKRRLARMRAYNGETIQERDLSQLFCLKLSEEHQFEVMQMIDELKTLEEVEFAEPNYRVYAMAASHIAAEYSSNPMESLQWYLDAYGVKELWDKPIINKERPIIAILDTGVDLTHPDLKDNLWTNIVEEYGVKDNDNDGNGFKNDIHGYDFVNNTSDIRDNNMHGTHVAGIAAASNNGIGIVGANPQALIMPITVLQSNGSGDIATIIKGIDYAVANGAKILNLSLGTYVNSLPLRQSLENAYSKAVIVAAAGNDGRCLNTYHYAIHLEPELKPLPMFPAAYSFVLGVQATKKGGALATFSNYDDDGANYSQGATFFDPDGFNYELKVPGNNMLSCIPGGGYKELNGTSMAAPLAAGAISALMMIKQYDTQEILWGDLLHSDNIAEAFSLTKQPAELDMIRVLLRERIDLSELTEEDYSGDNDIDAGETVNLYPVIRTTFGPASNIKLKVMVDDFEDPEAVELVKDEAVFGIRLDTYGKGVSVNPLVLRIPASTADGRIIKLKFQATCDETPIIESFPFSITVHNMIKINGLITEDMTLKANHVYYVNGNLGVNKGVKLTIEPGTCLEFAEGTELRSFGKLVAKGTPEKPIVFKRHAGEGIWAGIATHEPEGKHEYRDIYTNDNRSLFTVLPTENTPNKINRISRTVYYSPFEANPSRTFYMYNYIGGDGWNFFVANMSGKENKLTDPQYLTPYVLSMLNDLDNYCSQYSSTATDEKTESASVSAVLWEGNWATYDNPGDTLSYCIIEDCSRPSGPSPYLENCILRNIRSYPYLSKISGNNNLVTGCYLQVPDPAPKYNNGVMTRTNYINNDLYAKDSKYSLILGNNYFNNFVEYQGKSYSLGITSSSPTIDHSDNPSYLGTSREDVIRPYIYEMGNGKGTWGTVDLKNMRREPIKEAHGIVWKVLVNGKDAQDEFDNIAPLGVGKHKFEVYFNRPMNKAVAPVITFGVRAPYTQQSVAEDGSWNADGTIFTAYKTITGKTLSDGLNRIFIQGTEDDEFFECPYENVRFNVMIQAAGSMSSGFSAEAGLGCVNLKWNNENNNYENAMGYNVYRYNEPYQKYIPSGYGEDGNWHYGGWVTVCDTVCLNEKIIDIEAVSYTDYDVVPGSTYYYYYKVLDTDLQEYDMSNVVAATPLTSTRGDANGDRKVDILDVLTTVNYIVRKNPHPFIFEAADMNADETVDILDVVSLVQGVLDPNLLATATVLHTATYWIENDTLYVDSPIALGGIQVQLALNPNRDVVSDRLAVPADLNGFEQPSVWLSEDDYLLMAYSMSGKTLKAGKHALLYIDDGQVASIKLSDVTGGHVKTIGKGDNTTGIDRMGKDVMNVSGAYDLQGRKLMSSDKHNSLPHGIYIINGKKVVK